MPILAFQKPERVIMHKDTDFYGLFEFSPLEKGYGITIGNSLRRILLSSLEGHAITSIRIQGVEHEFSTIKGVAEDVTEIVLNLKQVRFKKVSNSDDHEKVFISIKGKDQFTAGDISRYTNTFEVLNPDLVICNMETSVNLEIEISIDKGRGYVAAEENKPKDAQIGLIPIDAIFTPIKNVKYTIEDFRVEQKTDYEKLIIEIQTDGSIHPENALKEAANILIQHFILFSDENILLDSQVKKPAQEVDENFLHMRKILKTNLAYDIDDLLKFRNFGKKSLSELEEFVREKGLNFGMDVSKYNLGEE